MVRHTTGETNKMLECKWHKISVFIFRNSYEGRLILFYVLSSNTYLISGHGNHNEDEYFVIPDNIHVVFLAKFDA